MAIKKYYINRDCVFSTLKKALEHEKSKRKEVNDYYNDEVIICHLNEERPVEVAVIDSYTGDVSIMKY